MSNRLFWLEGSDGRFKISKYSLTNKRYTSFKLTGLERVTDMTWDPDTDNFYLTDGTVVSIRLSASGYWKIFLIFDFVQLKFNGETKYFILMNS